MKKIIYLLILACIIGCERDEQNEKKFDFESIGVLNLESIDGFWDDNTDIDTSYYMGASFESDSGFVDGIRLYSENKAVWVSVFKTQSIAIDAMEVRRNNVACII